MGGKAGHRETSTYRSAEDKYPLLYGSVEDRKAAFLALLEEGRNPIVGGWQPPREDDE